jgi:hypothetical protein
MSTLKIVRDLSKRLKVLGIQMIEVPKNHKGHLRFDLTHTDGRVQRLILPSSPRVEEDAIENAMQAAKKFAAGRVPSG